MHPLASQVDWPAQERAAIELFRTLLRFDTTNPPGDEAPCAAFAADYLAEAGIAPEILEAQPGRANVVARLRGDGDEPPLMLSAHLDVVPADADAWTHPPFAGEIADGYLWGRGAVDMKNMAAMSLWVMAHLARSGARLRRDVIFTGVADEEAGCGAGSAWLVDEHADKVRAGFALGEVGGFTLHTGGTPVYPVQVAEKGVCWVRARARGTSGHASMPRDDNPVVRLATFLSRLGRTKLPLQPSAPVERFVTELAASQGGIAERVLPLLLNPRLSATVSRIALRDPSVSRMFDAILRNTASPVALRGGSKTNVIPSTAEADIDGRIAVGSTADELLAQLRRLAGPHIDFEVLLTREPHAASPDTELFRDIAAVVAEHHPGAVAVPNVIPGFTDAHYWSRLGTVCYGFSPVRLEADGPGFGDLFHADDERIPVDGFTAGLRMLTDVVCRFTVAG